ncbi:MAG TPA: Zn-ribbon domain-containing OB-fold protein [Candidatus Acidoferrales bacterium]|nr:Zn-ribbon domain-containing OB-fold protein [Candidatus Acidoferrales bacterium]
MPDANRPRVPIKPGFFTVPDDPAEPPKFLSSRCDSCGEYFYPRRAICAQCLSEKMTDVELEGRGTLYSYTFVHIPLFGSTNIEHMEGYGVGQIDLPEGPRIQAPLAGKQPEFHIGLKVVAELDTLREDGGRDLVIVRFRPVPESEVTR